MRIPLRMLLCWLVTSWGIAASAQTTVVVVDSLTAAPIEFATWELVGTGRAGYTELEGRFDLDGLDVGTYTLRLNYLGYEERTVPFSVGERPRQLTVRMMPTSVQLGAVTISAQLDGQRAAIQRQIAADQIVNVISKDRIEEIPDQNAAETVGRVAGVSVQREGGEATKVSIRGLSPRYNSITINGERIPATDAEDRSVDLSMVSTDAIDGIEVYKAITPDQDGDAVGGTVNFLLKKARQKFRGNFKVSNTYNAQQNDFYNPRLSGSLSNRFLDNKLGVIVTGNYQEANRSSDLLTAQYGTLGETVAGDPIIVVSDVNLADQLEERLRYGGSLSLDYDLPKGDLVWSTFYGATDRDQIRYRTRYRVDNGRKEYDLRQRSLAQRTLNSSLSGEHPLAGGEFTYTLGYARTSNETPDERTIRFRENGAFANNVDEGDIGSILGGTRDVLNNTFLNQDRIDETSVLTDKYTGALNYQRDFTYRNWLTGFVKAGGKLRRQGRERDSRRIWTAFDALDDIRDQFPDEFIINDDDRITVETFLGDHDPGAFLDDRFGVPFGPTLDPAVVNDFTDRFAGQFYSEDERLRLQNYRSSETVSAAYVMTKLVVQDRLTVIPGVRVERTQTTFDGLFGRSFELDGQVLINAVDTTGTREYTEWLPMVQAKYQLREGLDLRAAATRTLARPSFFDLVPYQQIDDINRVVRRGNADLRHTTAWNYDLSVSVYNKYGLVSLGGFHKVLDDVDFTRVSRDVDPDSGTRGYQLITQNNLPEPVRVLGLELDVQGNLSFLPKPFDGIVGTFNFTLIESETLFPQFETRPGEPPFFIPVAVDTFRTGILPDQPRSVLNAGLGYEAGGFSGRLSVVRQGQTLFFVGGRAELDGLNRAFTRWDLALKQRVGEYWSVFVNVNNITNTPEFTFLAADQRFPVEEEFFGWTADLGVRYKF